MGIFEDFIGQCVSDCVNARETKLCPTCDAVIEADVVQCLDCHERRALRDARNDSGAEEV